MVTMATFITKAKTLLYNTKPFPSNSMAVAFRHRSSRANNKAQLMEIDTSSSSDGEYEVTMKMFDDLIQRILVKKATPDWIPFVPGGSFWVPPRPTPSNVVHLVHKLTKDEDQQTLSAEESLSLFSLRGWPSPNYFIEGGESAHGGETGVDVNIPEGKNGKVKVKVLTFSENIAHSEDEEG